LTEPLFTVISPVYNVAPYLAEYFESLETQTLGLDRLDIILIDDGSSDESLVMCEEFGARHPANVRVLHKENGGQASARNLGLTLARAQWITFPDPDDVLSDNFFEAVHEYMNRPESARTVLFAGHIILWDEKTGRRTDKHATGFRFATGNSTTNLEGKPNFVHGNAVMSFFKREVIESAGLRFEETLRTRFEDGSFISQYLLHAGEPVLGLIADAFYYYRRRAQGNSTNQTAGTDPRTYTDVPKYGYLAVLALARKMHGRVPRWLQWLVIYDILWLFKSDVATKIPTRSLPADVLATFHENLREVMSYMEEESPLGFDMMAVPTWTKEALAHGYDDAPYLSPVRIGPPDPSRNLIQIRYRFSGPLPDEALLIRGTRVTPRYAKTQTLDVLGRTLLRERSLWVSSLGVIRFELDGKIQRFEGKELPGSAYKFRRSEIEASEREAAVAKVPALFRRVQEPTRARAGRTARHWLRLARRATRRNSVYDFLLAIALRLPGIRQEYAGAWALIDSEFQANDSAEELYRWIRQNKPETKIRFILSKQSGDWARLKDDGFTLVEYGSYRWKILMLLARHVISSHADLYISNPLPLGRYGPPPWKLSFLQHGVIKGDLSTWLNRKNLAFFVTSTEAEYRYIAGESPYKFGPKEVHLTGLPRHDSLLRKSQAVPAAEVKYLLVAPTWRQYLAGNFIKGSVREQNEQFMESEYATAWQELLQSEDLRRTAEENGLKIVFMPHPNIQPYLSSFDVPNWVETRMYANVDVQDVMCRSAVMITDYSSIAFNMAYLHRPVIYFQFDRARYEAEHTEGKGYYDYATHGFGPVESDEAGVVASLGSLFSSPDFAKRFAERAEEAFPVRDGRNAERVYNRIRELDEPLTFEEATVPAPLDSWEEHRL
jgi:glycosyltransferase involved in cell wall biosynthesis